jgi:hypothetical protein
MGGYELVRRGDYEAHLSFGAYAREVNAYWHFHPEDRRYASGIALVALEDLPRLQASVRAMWAVHWHGQPLLSQQLVPVAIVFSDRGAPRALSPFPNTMHGIRLQLRSEQDVEEFCQLLDDLILAGMAMQETADAVEPGLSRVAAVSRPLL